VTRMSGTPLKSRMARTWRSLLSWMRWSRRRRDRQRQEWLRLQKLQEEWLLQCLRSLLLEALEPMAAALQRQDQLTLEKHGQLMDLQREILQSLQPTAQEQVFQRLGLPTPQLSSHNSEH
jgi:hypothetical protein